MIKAPGAMALVVLREGALEVLREGGLDCDTGQDGSILSDIRSWQAGREG